MWMFKRTKEKEKTREKCRRETRLNDQVVVVLFVVEVRSGIQGACFTARNRLQIDRRSKACKIGVYHVNDEFSLLMFQNSNIGKPSNFIVITSS